jgi:CRISPR-associated protein Csx10
MITRYYPLTLTLDAPLLLTTMEGDPNSAESLDFIPGSSIRGAVARALCVQGLDRSNPDKFRRLVISGRTRYLNGYMQVKDRRSLPTPASFRREKYQERYHDLAGIGDAASADKEDREGYLEEQLERPDFPYITLDRPDLFGAKLAGTGRIHQQRDRVVGRPREGVGAIFRYDSLDAGQVFRALIAVTEPDEATLEQTVSLIQQALGTILLLGRSRRSGYGGAARISWSRPEDREAEGGRILSKNQPADQILRCLLTSDFMGRSPLTGQSDPTAFQAELARRLGGRVDIRSRYFEFRKVGGYNRKWGLELPQGLALKAGSLLLLRARTEIPLADLLELEHTGLGERRAEGFGRVLFLDQPGRSILISPEDRTAPNPPSLDASPLLQAMQERLLWEAVDQRILERATDLIRDVKEIPSRSLLGRLRIPLRQPAPKALAELRRWLADGEHALRKPARRLLDACRLARPPQSLDAWLQTMASPGEPTAHQLGHTQLAQQYYFVSEQSAREVLERTDWDLRIRAKLIDAVLAALARRKQTETTVGEAGHAP